jgi:DNA-binding CsgD family transcriptional regulator
MELIAYNKLSSISSLKAVKKPSLLIGEDLLRLHLLCESGKILTKREIEILQLIAQGFRTKHIADKLYISFETVSTHRKQIIRKFNAKSTPHLVGIAKDIGLI